MKFALAILALVFLTGLAHGDTFEDRTRRLGSQVLAANRGSQPHRFTDLSMDPNFGVVSLWTAEKVRRGSIRTFISGLERELRYEESHDDDTSDTVAALSEANDALSWFYEPRRPPAQQVDVWVYPMRFENPWK